MKTLLNLVTEAITNRFSSGQFSAFEVTTAVRGMDGTGSSLVTMPDGTLKVFHSDVKSIMEDMFDHGVLTRTAGGGFWLYTVAPVSTATNTIAGSKTITTESEMLDALVAMSKDLIGNSAIAIDVTKPLHETGMDDFDLVELAISLEENCDLSEDVTIVLDDDSSLDLTFEALAKKMFGMLNIKSATKASVATNLADKIYNHVDKKLKRQIYAVEAGDIQKCLVAGTSVDDIIDTCQQDDRFKVTKIGDYKTYWLIQNAK